MVVLIDTIEQADPRVVVNVYTTSLSPGEGQDELVWDCPIGIENIEYLIVAGGGGGGQVLSGIIDDGWILMRVEV